MWTTSIAGKDATEERGETKVKISLVICFAYKAKDSWIFKMGGKSLWQRKMSGGLEEGALGIKQVIK